MMPRIHVTKSEIPTTDHTIHNIIIETPDFG
jgi:hypothetical protein